MKKVLVLFTAILLLAMSIVPMAAASANVMPNHRDAVGIAYTGAGSMYVRADAFDGYRLYDINTKAVRRDLMIFSSAKSRLTVAPATTVSPTITAEPTTAVPLISPPTTASTIIAIIAAATALAFSIALHRARY